MQSSSPQIGFGRQGYTTPSDLQDTDDSDACRWCLMMDCPSLASSRIVCAQNPNGEDPSRSPVSEDGFFRLVRKELDARYLSIELDDPEVHSKIQFWYDLDFTPDQVIEYLELEFEDRIVYCPDYDYV